MTERQPHEVVDRPDGFELRRYPSHLVAGIEVGGSFDEAPDPAFCPLAGFIDGANRSRRQIAMTAPVTQQNAGPEQIAMTARWCSRPPAGPVRTAGRRLRLRRSPARALIRPRPRLQNSKLAFLWFTYELQRRLPPRAITANAVCPGSSPPLPRQATRPAPPRSRAASCRNDTPFII